MNRADMIFDLSSIWATVKEEFPYFDRLEVDWDAQYRTYLEKILQVNDEGEFHRLLREFMDSLKDGHTKYFPPAPYRKVRPYVQPDAPSFTLNEGVLTIRINEFMKEAEQILYNEWQYVLNVDKVGLMDYIFSRIEGNQ